MSHFWWFGLTLKKTFPQIYRASFHNVSLWKKSLVLAAVHHVTCNYTVWPLCQIGFKAQRTSWMTGNTSLFVRRRALCRFPSQNGWAKTTQPKLSAARGEYLLVQRSASWLLKIFYLLIIGKQQNCFVMGFFFDM